jgi:hypothetical protein
MAIDSEIEAFQNRRVSPEACRTPELVLREQIDNLSVLVLDLDGLGYQDTIDCLESASEDCRFVVWFPRRYSPSDAAHFHQALVESGATPLTRNTSNEKASSCWTRLKESVLRESRSVERESSLAVGGSAGPF